MPRTSFSRLFLITSIFISIAAIAAGANWWSASSYSFFSANETSSVTGDRADDKVPEGLSPSDWAGIRAAYDANRPSSITAISQEAYLKPAAVGTTQSGDDFGYSVAVSGDTVVVGAYFEDSSTTGVNSTANEGSTDSGAAYVFVRSAGVWTQQAYLKPDAVGTTQAGDGFGVSVAIAGDTVVIGAYREDSGTTGINSTADESSADSGAAYVFTRSAGVWTQQAYLKPATVGSTQTGDEFGRSVAVSGDTVVVGAYLEDSGTTGVNSAANESAANSGAAYIFTRSAGVWTQQAYVKPAAFGTTQVFDEFARSVALSGDTLVVGAWREDSSTTGVNGTANESSADSGAAYVFTRTAGVWTQQAYLKPGAVGTTQTNDGFGYSVGASDDTVVVGAYLEDSSTTGVNSTANESASAAGAAYVFVRSAGVWTQQAYLKPATVGSTQTGDNFGISTAVSGETIVVGAHQEDSGTLGVNSSPNESAFNAGAAYVFVRSASVWTQQAYLKPAAIGTAQGLDGFGWSVALSDDTVAIGAPSEDSGTTGVNTTPNEISSAAGAAYIFAGLGPPSPTPTDTPTNTATNTPTSTATVTSTSTFTPTPSASPSCYATPSGLVSFYKAENNANDQLGLNNGTLVNATTFTAGVVGQAFSFNGGSSAVTIPDSPSLALTTSLTLSAWVNAASLAPGLEDYILFRGDNRGALDPYTLAVEPSGHARFRITSAGGGWATLLAPITTGQWFHLAGTLDDSTGAMKLYVNGVEAASTTTSIRPFGPLDPAQSPGVAIGNLQSGFGQGFHGLIDEVAIFDRDLSASEVVSIYNAGSTGECFTPTPTATATPSPALVINEIDYDTLSTDDSEFIELKNVGGVEINLDPVVVELVNGAASPTIYQSIDLPNVDLAPDDYYVICGDTATVLNCDLHLTPGTNIIQNGAPDAIGLRLSGDLIDAVSYEGNTDPPYTEGSGIGLTDDNATVAIGLSRFPDGADTNVNNIDLSLRCITPGEVNISSNSGCAAGTSPTPTGTATNTPTNTPTATATATSTSTPPQVTLFSEDFSDNSAGWTIGNEWQIGPATASTGHGSGFPDPDTDTTATADNGVAGIIIGGNASTTVHAFYYIESPPINATVGGAPVTLEFNRWLNSDYLPYMQNVIEAWNGTAWVQIWITGASPAVTDSVWTPQTFDLTAYQNPELRVRFGMRVGSTGALTVSSWNLDDIAITSTVAASTPTFTPTLTPTSTPFSGSHDVGAGQTYTSLTMPGGIFEAMNTVGVSGSVTINIVSDLSGEDGVVALNEFASGSDLLIKPSGASRTITGSGSTGIIRLNGTDMVTIDGSTDGSTVSGVIGGNAAIRQLTIENTNASTTSSVIILDSGPNGAKNNTVKNLNIRGSGPDQTGYLIAIGGSTGGTQGADNDNNLIENCGLRRSIIGIWSSGSSPSNQNQNTTIKENDITGTDSDRIRRAAITVGNENYVRIYENSIGGIDSSLGEDVVGIGVGLLSISNNSFNNGGITEAEIHHNKINGVRQTGGRSASGIAMASKLSESGGQIFDNMVTGVISDATGSDIVAGIFVAGTGIALVAHNSVSMTGDRGSTSGQTPSYAFAVTGTDPLISVTNNIFYTTQTSGGGSFAQSYAIGLQTSGFSFSALDYNDFWSSGTNDGGFRRASLAGGGAGLDHADIAAWRTAISQDANSIEADPLFINPTNDPHIQALSPARNAGTDLSYPFDFDYHPRPQEGFVEIGADELIAATPTATNTPTPSGTPSISGTVTYGNPASPTTKFISNATVNGAGSPNVTAFTAVPGPTAGQYILTGFGGGSYTVSLAKTTGQNSISSADAARIAQHVAGTLLMTNDRQKIAADVTNNGALSSTDAAQLARFVTALGPPIGLTNQWRFFVPGVSQPTFPIGSSPTTRSYTDPIGVQTGQDYIGILIGEVTGNWTPTAARPADERQETGDNRKETNGEGGPLRGISVELPSIDVTVGNELVVPVNVEGMEGKGVIAYEFDLRYDPSVLQPVGDAVDVRGTVSRGLSVVTNPTEPGLLRVVVYGAYPIDSDGVLLNLRFTAVGAAGSVSPVSFERIMFNEGEPRVLVTDGKIDVN